MTKKKASKKTTKKTTKKVATKKPEKVVETEAQSEKVSSPEPEVTETIQDTPVEKTAEVVAPPKNKPTDFAKAGWKKKLESKIKVIKNEKGVFLDTAGNGWVNLTADEVKMLVAIIQG